MKKQKISWVILIFLAFFQVLLSQNKSPFSLEKKFQSSLIEPKSIIKTGDEHYFIDFGQDAFGTLVLTINSNLNDTLVIHLGEKTLNSYIIDRNPGGSIRYQNVKISDIPQKIPFTVKLKSLSNLIFL